MFSLPKQISGKLPKRRVLLQNPKILEVNLIKDEGLLSFDWNKNLLVLVLVLFLAGLLILEIYFGLGWWEEQEAARLEPTKALVAQTNAAAAKLKNQTAAALAYKDKSAAFSWLLGNHVYWSNFFSWLERNTLSTVKYDSFSGGLDGSYVLTATAPSYADVSWQVKAFRNDPSTKKASVTSVKSAGSAAAGQVNFTLSLQVDPAIFKK
jgi:hypothetical protein